MWVRSHTDRLLRLKKVAGSNSVPVKKRPRRWGLFLCTGSGVAFSRGYQFDWTHVDLVAGGVELAGDEDGRKPGGSWRVVPLNKAAPGSSSLRMAGAGRTKRRKGLPSTAHPQEPQEVDAKPAKKSPGPLAGAGPGADRPTGGKAYRRHLARSRWRLAKVCSQIMGHKTPEYQPGAARITLERYTHVLPGKLEHARERLDGFLDERT